MKLPISGWIPKLSLMEMKYLYKPWGLKDKEPGCQGRGYNVQSTDFSSNVLHMIKGENLTEFSNVYNCNFNATTQTGYVSTGIFDNSDSEIQVNGSLFNDNYIGIQKSNGRLNLRCNAFNDFFWSGVEAYNNCWLEMSSASKNGYNTFDKLLAGTPHNIGLHCAEYMQIKFGYNRFDDDGSTPIIEGSVQIGPPSVAKQYMHAHKNEWNLFTNGVIPGPGRFDITSCITNSNIPLIVVDPQDVVCGAFDPDITTPIGVGSMNGTKKLTTTHFNNEKMSDAVNYTIKQTERFDDQKNDLFALELFEEILTYDYNNPNKETTWLIQYTSEYMKHTVQHCFTTGKITREGNEAGFCGGMQRYANVLNFLTEDDIDDNNYERMFYLEMDKVHLFHMLGNYDLALDILYNMELCGLDYQEQSHINDWKYKLETEKAKFEYGFEAEFKDTVWADTANYFTPTNQAYGNFGSEIINEKTVVFYNCNNPKAPFSNKNAISFDVFPNPTTGETNISFSNDDEIEAQFVISGIDGKSIRIFSCPQGSQTFSIDLSLIPSGIYIIELRVQGVVINSQKLIKN